MADTSMIIGVFSDRADAENAVNDLHAADYNAKDISIVTHDQDDARVIEHNTGSKVADSTISGATTGGVIGGLAGLLVGVGAIAIPGLGAVLIGGPLALALGLTGAAATTLSGAVTGAVAGGLVGALVGIGIPEEDARVYEDHVRAGGILVAVPVGDRSEGTVRDILEDNGAERVKSFSLNTHSHRTAAL